MSQFPARSDAKPIHVPAGDHAGVDSWAGVSVNRRVRPSASRIHRSASRAKTISPPGPHEGESPCTESGAGAPPALETRHKLPPETKTMLPPSADQLGLVHD